MKINKYIFILLLVSGIVACTQDMDDLSLPAPVAESAITITATETSVPNVFEFSANVPEAILNWDFGNGNKAKGAQVSASYPFKGTYTVTLTVLSAGGITTKTTELEVINDNYDLVNDPLFNMISGGIAADNGKTWVLDSTMKGHLGCGAVESTTSDWWTANPKDKAGKQIYDDEITFVLKGAQFVYENHGKTYVNGGAADLMKARGATLEDEGNYGPAGDDKVATYTPATGWSWSIQKEDGKNYIVFPEGQGFIMFFTPEPHKYEIVSITEDEMMLRQQLPDICWYFKLIRKGLERPVEPEKPVVPEAHVLTEDFEGAAPAVEFVQENMGAKTSWGYANPAPVPVNESDQVYLYEKSGDFYSNIYFQAGYKFDLATVHKIRLKVYIPSYNDYDTENDVAGDWIANRKLLPQLSVKLQDSSKGGNAWETQTEIVKTDLEFNRWIELEYDFGPVADRTDYDKIVLQFGAEGHSGSGIFFFDDFEFGE